ncbi:MAG: O-antigen ligase family protein [Dokdonella sp.]|uniref:O-antigen ligase family protein n=1 Tax=Dokdonella sp. TaxID=2291710 RepID=UPI003265C12C
MIFILIYIALVIVRPQDYPQLGDGTLPLLTGTLAVAAGAWLVAGRKTFAQPQYPLLFAFLIVTMISILVNGWAGGAIEQAADFAPTVIAFVLLANALTTPRRMIVTMQVFVLCSCVLALHGVLQVQNGIGWTGMPLVQDDGRIQYVGIFSDPNDLGLLFVAVLPMAFHLARRGGMLGLVRLTWLAAAALLLYGVYLTNSRGALLAVASMIGVWLWLRRGVITAMVVGGGGLALMQMLPSRLQDLDAAEESAAGRIDAWYEGLQMFQSQPLFGVGAHNFTEHNYLTAHNSFVLVLAETGIVGYTVWLAFVGYGFRMMLALCRYAPADADASTADAWRAEREAGVTLLVSLAGFFTAAFFLSRSYVIVLYLFAAMVVAQYTQSRERFPGLPEFRLGDDLARWGMLSVGSIALLYLVVRVLL